RLVEEIDQGLGHHRADALDRRQLGLRIRAPRRRLEPLDRAERLHQILGGDNPDMADAEPEQEARRVEADSLVEGVETVVDRLGLPALAADQLAALSLQAKDVGRTMKPAQLNELDDAFLAQPVDVHRAARHEMPQALDPLPRADQPAGAANVDLAFFGNRFRMAFGA